jgi:hypothetical protein
MDSVSHDPRIDKKHGLDRIGAHAFVIVLWVTILFTIISIWSNVQNGGIRVLLLVSGALVLLFNTASIVAMLRHYTSDKQFIYGLDLKHLDEMRRAKRI